MGCRSSKIDDLPLVIRCRERKRLIKSAVDYRYDLSSSHLAYFHSLKDIGYVLSRFVDEQLVIPSPSPSSPVLTLPSDAKSKNNSDSISHNHDSDSELSHSLDGHIHIHDDDDDHDDENSGFENQPPPYSNFHQPHDYNEMNFNDPYASYREPPPYQGPNQTNWADPYMGNPYGFAYQPPWGPNQTGFGEGDPSASQYQPHWGPYQVDFDSYNRYGFNPNSNPNQNPNQQFFYMKKSAPSSHTVIQQEEVRGFQETSQWVDPPNYDPYAYGFSYGGSSPPPQESKKPKSPPPPPPPPMESDYFNFFNAYDNENHGYGYGYGYEKTDSSPDTVNTNEVREMEGIPDLEEETETESHNEEVIKTKTFSTKGKDVIEDSFGKTPPNAADVASTSYSVPLENKERTHTVNTDVDKHSSESIISHSTEEGKKGKSFDIDDASPQELESSVLSSLTTLSPHGTRDLHEVVNEIKDEFESAFGHGKEVALMLEAGKIPYQSKFVVLKVILSKILYPLAHSSNHSIQSVSSSSRVTKLAGSYNEDAAADVRPIRPVNLSSTLEKLYAWEKKLYKEVKVIGLVWF